CARDDYDEDWYFDVW
nr:immunoglobulin heavy chain junction region [Mus musculus]